MSDKLCSSSKCLKFTQDMFYGRNKTLTLPLSVRIKRRLQEVNGKHAPAAYKTRLFGPCSSWKVFHRQKDAFNFVKKSSQDLRVWSYESDVFVEHRGQRLFLVASYEQFWHYYRQLPSSQRHHYEVIPEGAPCNLYFDLEYSTAANPSLHGSRMVDIFIQFVCHQLLDLYNIKCTKDNILQLDASIPTKFSQHLIFRLDNVVFLDNTHAGGFVNHVCALIETILRNAEKATIQIDTGKSSSDDIDFRVETHSTTQNEHSTTTCELEDYERGNYIAPSLEYKEIRENQEAYSDSLPAIYTKTSGSPQCETRITQSRGRAEIEDEAISHFTCRPMPSTGTECLSVLRQAGLSVKDLCLLQVNDKQGNQVLFCDRGVYTKNRNFRLYLSSKLGKTNPLVVADGNVRGQSSWICTQEQVFLDSLVSNVRHQDFRRLLTWEQATEPSDQRSPSSLGRNQTAASTEGYNTKSPYPEVDAFVTSVITSEGLQGHIRRWSYFQDAELLIYDIAGNRWCQNVRRQHRSNNIMIVADLQKGVYYQKCHDPDCRRANFKSQDRPLPKEVLPSYIMEEDDALCDFAGNIIDHDEDMDSLDDDMLRHVELEDDGVTPEHAADPRDFEVDEDPWDVLEVDDHVLVEAQSLMEDTDDVAFVAALTAAENNPDTFD